MYHFLRDIQTFNISSLFCSVLSSNTLAFTFYIEVIQIMCEQGGSKIDILSNR